MPPPFGRRRPDAGAAPSREFARRKIGRYRRAGKGHAGSWRGPGRAGSLPPVIRERSSRPLLASLWIAFIAATPWPTHAQQDSARVEGTARSRSEERRVG